MKITYFKTGPYSDKFKHVRLFVELPKGKDPRKHRIEVYKLLRRVRPELSCVTLQWRSNAGCSCGCSPGFVLLDTNPTYLGYQAIWMTVTVK